MRARTIALFLLLTTIPLGGWQCAFLARGVDILEPGLFVDEFSFELSVELSDAVDPATLLVEINGTDVTDRMTGGPNLFTATIEPGAPLRDHNVLMVRALKPSGQKVWRTRAFAYLPPGKARAKRIQKEQDLILGPLAHSRLGDWLLENGEARFAIQDVGQRELYSVGQFGGNLIDAELRDNPGMDNFLELQPGVNIETVINAQTLTIVNDGQDGTAAVIRSCGPDDLLDFVNPSSQIADLGFPGVEFPAIADDQDLEIEGCTSYSLAPGETRIRLDTEIFNNQVPGEIPPGIPEDLGLAVGDWLNPAGELDTFVHPTPQVTSFDLLANGVGPPTLSTLGSIGFYGYDEAAGVDYAFMQEPLPDNPVDGSLVFISGVIVTLHSQAALPTLLGLDPVNFEVPLGGSRTFTRWFAVGDGSASTAIDLENQVRGTVAGELSGCVTVAGAPVAGARVVVGNPLGDQKPATNANRDFLASHFTTREGPCPNYAGSLPEGSYLAAAGLDGHLYDSGLEAPNIVPVEIASGVPANLDFDLPASGELEVSVVDASGAPLPARVTVVGFDPSPELTSSGPQLPGFGGGPMGLLNDMQDPLPFGVVAVGYTQADGVVRFPIEPGVAAYHVFVSRGSEYSLWRTAAPIDVTAGSTTVLAAQLARVVDTPGFISSDFHVHGIRSADSRVSDVHRIESYSSEGVENLIMTDHHVHTDLTSVIAAAGMTNFLTATIGEEITTFDYGHFNAYPLLVDPDSPSATWDATRSTQLSGGSTDWAKAAPPGEDFPSFGAYSATPAEIHQLATAGALSIPGVSTIQINHIGSHFNSLKIDTALVPPADLMTDEDRAIRRLPDTATAPNLFHHFPALELWNGSSRGAQNNFLDDRIGVWFNHLHQGMRTTFIADTDSHRFTNLNSAGARTWTASPSDAPAAIDPADVAASVNAGRAVGGQGVYVQTRLRATDGSGDAADLSWSGDVEMSDAGGNVVLDIDVQSPAWAAWDTIEIYANAATTPAGSYEYGATPTLTLSEGDCDPATAGVDFDIEVTPDVGGVAGADRWSAHLEVPFAGLAEETFFVVVVRGSTSDCGGMFPVYPDGLQSNPNATLADLVDGNVGEGNVTALGATNALYFVP